MLKNIIKLDLAPGGDLPVWENLQREMSILNILPTSTQVVRKTQRKEKTIGTQSIIVHMTTMKRWMGSKKDPTSQQAPTSRARRISQCMQCSYLHYLGIRTNTISEYGPSIHCNEIVGHNIGHRYSLPSYDQVYFGHSLAPLGHRLQPTLLIVARNGIWPTVWT